ncbi:hypothetical protein D3C81_1661820 [compost metagenome]
MLRHKTDYPLLHFVQIFEGLGYADNQAVQADGMDGHRSSLRNNRAIRRYGDRDTDAVPAPQHQSYGRFRQGGDHFGNGQTCLHIPSDCIQNYQNAFYLRVLLGGYQLGNQMLIFGGFVLGRQYNMPFDLPDNRHRKNIRFPVAGRLDLTQLGNGFYCFFLLHRHRLRRSGLFRFVRHALRPLSHTC